MGFPVAYSELFLPRLLLHLASLLAHLRCLLLWALSSLGLADLLDSDSSSWPAEPLLQQEHHSEFHSVSALLIQELLPVVRFCDLRDCDGYSAGTDSCAVCLHELEEKAEVRRLGNCRHVFHSCCLDRWVEHDQHTCPLCRAPLVPSDLQGALNERIWASAGVPDSFSEYSLPLS